MTLEANIAGWTEDRVKAAHAILNEAIHPYQATYGKNFPQVALMTGNNWIYVASVQPYNGRGKIHVDGVVLDSSMAVKVDLLDLGRSARFVSLTDTLDIFQTHYNGSDYALIPVGEVRQREARELGNPIAKTGTWYDVEYKEKTIKVFPTTKEELPNFYLMGRFSLRKLRRLLKPLLR